MTPEWWGAVDSNWADSTVAVQSAMDSAARGILLMSSYQVSRVSLEGSGRLLVRTHYLSRYNAHSITRAHGFITDLRGVCVVQEGRGGGFTAMTNARPNPLQLPPPGTLNAVLEIKCSYSRIQNLGVTAAYNGTYTAAVHWYTNDLSIWSVEFNQIKNMHVTYAKIAFLVGAAPGEKMRYISFSMFDSKGCGSN